MYRSKMLDLAIAVGGAQRYHLPSGGTTYYGCHTGSGRGAGWGLSRLLEADTVVPDDWPTKALITKVMENTSKFYEVRAVQGDTRHLGILEEMDRTAYMGYQYSAMARIVRSGKYPMFVAAVECTAINLFDLWDDLGEVNNAGAGINTYEYPLERQNGHSGSPWPSLRTMFLSFFPDTMPATGFEASGYAYESRANTYSANLYMGMVAYVNLRELGLAFLPARVKRIQEQILTRMTSAGSSYPRTPYGDAMHCVLYDVPAANKQLRALPYGGAAIHAITGPTTTATVGQNATFAVTAPAYPVHAGRTTGGSRVEVVAAGNVVLPIVAAGAQTVSTYSVTTGGAPLATSASFTAITASEPPADGEPGATSSLYDFTWFATNDGNDTVRDMHNVSGNPSYFPRCVVAKKTDATRAPGQPSFVLSPVGTDPRLATRVEGADIYTDGAFHIFLKSFTFPGNYTGVFDLWIKTADNHWNKDPSGTYTRT